jgi:hypothetical protein
VWKRFAAAVEWDSVIDRNRGLNEADLKACFTERVRTQLMAA